MSPELSALPDPPAARDRPSDSPADAVDQESEHRVKITERGSFAFATCGCGWYAPARRSRDLARRDAAGHLVSPD
ncbi:hypothetical protein P3T37_003244 [Kitasatospora sp. MAA4]|uniref:hypothetical protein n=1 Tax=Kitasatospora sp. MAA4 TaxID=3035093 RepID=UPI00247584C0|nr:hypothetical protein [Kitasatospora sp. MAA4]MDH6133845.1 hypothetical protein [Kitasatospora sp. MAA4]